MGLYGALRDPVSGLLALPPVRLMIVAVLTNLALTPLLSKPAMPLSDFSECQPDAVWKDTCWSKAPLCAAPQPATALAPGPPRGVCPRLPETSPALW